VRVYSRQAPMKRFGWITPLLSAGSAGFLAALIILPAAAMAEGMPQLDFKTPLTFSQVVWGAIIFVALYFLLSRSSLPLVASVLDERAAHIGRDLESARSAKASADTGIEEARQAIARARAEAQTAISAALDEAKQTAAAHSEALNAHLEARLQEAETQIAQARIAAMGALRQVATDTTSSVVTRLTGTPPNPTQLDGAVAAAMAARGVAAGFG
jgi:F-type H+-transporting ATPase subunit b